MRMRELSLRQDPDLRKELALLARGCDFVLPSRFKKRLRAFQQGQAGVCMSVRSTKQALLACQPLSRSINVEWYLWASYLGIQIALLQICCITGCFSAKVIAPIHVQSGTIGVIGASCTLDKCGQMSNYITFSRHN